MATEPTIIMTPVFRVSFPNLFVARKAQEGDGPAKYGCTAIWTPSQFKEVDKKHWKELVQALDAETQLRFKKAWKDLQEGGPIKLGLRNGKLKEDLDGFGDGTYFASLTSNLKPHVYDLAGNEISPENGNEDEIYAGCYCRARVNVYSYDNKGKGVAIGLRSIQKIRDGERLDGRGSDAQNYVNEEIDSSWLDQDEGSADDDIPF